MRTWLLSLWWRLSGRCWDNPEYLGTDIHPDFRAPRRDPNAWMHDRKEPASAVWLGSSTPVTPNPEDWS